MPGGRVSELWRYPVKSLQGQRAQSLTVTDRGVVGDRRWGIVPDGRAKVLSAKRVPQLLDAFVDGDTLVLPDGRRIAAGDPGVDAVLSSWLGQPVRLVSVGEADGVSYDMTFDPPNDDAEVFAIPVPPGTFLDLAPVHLVTTATLAACASRRPDLDFDVRRFRPNLVVDGDTEPFAEDGWAGRELAVGAVTLRVTQPTVRCAMPLRAQPATGDGAPPLHRQPGLHDALVELNAAFPNHLGVYAEVVTGGEVAVGDPVTLGS